MTRYSLAALLFLPGAAFAQGQVLELGDIAFTSFQSDIDKGFSFVTLWEIDAGTEIKFTDAGWQNGALNLSNFGDGVVTWTADVALPAGTHVVLAETAASGWVASHGATPVEAPSDWNLSFNGDQLFAFQGTTDAPSFIAGINFNDPGWDPTNLDDFGTDLPPDLLPAAVYIPEADNGQYAGCPLDAAGTPDELVALIFDADNWVTSDDPFVPREPDCTFDVEFVCGNGEVEPGEECDEGGDADGCDADCTYQECNDGYCNWALGENPVDVCPFDCAPVSLDSCAFEHLYNADCGIPGVEDDGSGWEKTGNFYLVVEDGRAHFNTLLEPSVTGTWNATAFDSGAVAPDGAYSFEARVRIAEDSCFFNCYDSGLHLFAGTTNSLGWLAVDECATYWGPTEEHLDDNCNDEMTVFRVTTDDGTSFRVWRNGELIGDDLEPDDPDGYQMGFGDLFEYTGVIGSIDYFRWEAGTAWGLDRRFDCDDDFIRDWFDSTSGVPAGDCCPDDPGKLEPGSCGCGVADDDTDEDNILDCFDRCPGFDDFADADLDHHPDGCDACDGDDDWGDTDADGMCDDLDACPNSATGDTDGDGVCDDLDLCPATPVDTVVGEAGCAEADVDSDADGLCNPTAVVFGPGPCTGIDNCPVTFNPEQSDTDADGVGNACDVCIANSPDDTDGDGVCDEGDHCPATAASTAVDGFGCSDAQVDADGDGVCDPNTPNHTGGPSACTGRDNCPATANADQADGDGDALGDACDACIGSDPSGDGDADGYCALGVSGAPGDCNDADNTVFPGATELCDGKDNGCSGRIPIGEQDRDGDGQRACDGDCNDNHAATFAGAEEICDGLDNNCDMTIPADEVDADNDGVATCEGDCDDESLIASPHRQESCGDGVDNNCDGSVDETCPPEDEVVVGPCAPSNTLGGAGASWLGLLLTLLVGRRRRAAVSPSG